MQGEVDVLGLSEQLPVQAGLADSIRPSQVHQVELGAPQGGRARLTSAHVHGENTVGPRGCLVHRSLGKGRKTEIMQMSKVCVTIFNPLKSVPW